MPKVSDLDKQVQKLAKEFSASNAKIEDLANKVTENSAEIHSLSQDIHSNQEETRTLTHVLETSNAKIQTVADQIAPYKSVVEKWDPKNNGFSSMSEKLSTTVERLDSFKVELSRVNESIFLLRSEEKEISEKLEAHDVGISEVKLRIESIVNEQVEQLTRRIESFEEKIQHWGDNISELTQTVTGMSQKIPVSAPNNGSSDEVAQQLATISQRLEGLEKNLVENNTKIVEIQDSLSKISKRPAMIESEISAIGPEMFDEF